MVQPIFCSVFGASFITICVAMLSIQIEMEQNNLVLILIPTFELFGTFTFLFAPCELADRMSSKFDEINYLVNQLDWYPFSYDMNKMLLIILINARKEVGFQCFGSCVCNRDTFRKVSWIFNRIEKLRWRSVGQCGKLLYSICLFSFRCSNVHSHILWHYGHLSDFNPFLRCRYSYRNRSLGLIKKNN